jgi:hypothetical protein
LPFAAATRSLRMEHNTINSVARNRRPVGQSANLPRRMIGRNPLGKSYVTVHCRLFLVFSKHASLHR